MNFEEIKTIHFIGIGGVGISALARLMLTEGKNISGTNDSESSETLDEFRQQGIKISLDQDPKNLSEADMYVYSDAWLTNNPAMIEAAKAKGKLVMSYFEALGIAAQNYKVIAIAGAHGKTTTTAMVADVLEDAGLSPTVVVGSIRAKTKSNLSVGSGPYLVVEADEWRRHFLHFTPYILIILNIDDDHLDYYKDIEDIKSAFKELVGKIPADGYVICDLELPHVADVVRGARCTVVDYELFGDQNLELKVPGAHMISNAAAVFALADVLGISRNQAKESLKNFTGTWRRFEYKGTTEKGTLIYDDYGHHPTEVKATLKGARELFKDKKITVIFQPHLYSRTKQHLKAFGSSFNDVDSVIVAPIFAARETPDPTVSAALLADEINQNHVSAMALPSLESIENHIKTNCGDNEVVITMGAGNVYKIGENLILK